MVQSGVYSFYDLLDIGELSMRGTVTYKEGHFKGVRTIYVDRNGDSLSLEFMDERGDNFGCIVVNEEQQLEISETKFGYVFDIC